MNPKLIKGILLVGVFLVVVGAIVLSVEQYNKNQNNKKQAQETTQSTLANKVSQLEARQKDLTAKYEEVRLNCEKGVNSHAQLPTIIRNKVEQPNCGQAVLN